MAAGKGTTPLRGSLAPRSSLIREVQDGIGAVKGTDCNYFDVEIRSAFGDSLDLDAALLKQHSQKRRWDYLLAHSPSREIIGVEPHSAKEDQISTIIRKREAAKDQLASHLKPGRRVSRWLWVASGRVHFAATEKAKLRLDQNGIQFVGRRVLAKHLPKTAPNQKGHGRTRRKSAE